MSTPTPVVTVYLSVVFYAEEVFKIASINQAMAERRTDGKAQIIIIYRIIIIWSYDRERRLALLEWIYNKQVPVILVSLQLIVM